MNNGSGYVAVFNVIKGDTVSYEMHIHGPSREMLAFHIANTLKNRVEGSLLDIALAEADTVVADCFTIEEVMAQRAQGNTFDNNI